MAISPFQGGPIGPGMGRRVILVSDRLVGGAGLLFRECWDCAIPNTNTGCPPANLPGGAAYDAGGTRWLEPIARAAASNGSRSDRREAKKAGGQTKSSFGDFFKKLAGKPAGASPATMTNIRPRRSHTRARPRRGLRRLRHPFVDGGLPPAGDRHPTRRRSCSGAGRPSGFAAPLRLLRHHARSQRDHITITSQMQFHTQRLAKAAGIAARGQAAAFAQVQDSRDEFANFLGILQNGGFAFGNNVPPAAISEELKSRLEELAQRWPESAQAATAILAAQRELVPLAQNIAQVRTGSEEMATLSQELTGLMTQSGSPPGQVLRANRLTFLAERLGRGSAEILGTEEIDPEVPFLIGKDTNDLRELLRALESGSDALGVVPIRDTETRAKHAELKKQFATFEQNVGPILRELQKLVTARQAGAKLVAASEQLQSAVGRLQEAIQAEKSDATLYAVAIVSTLLFVVLVLMALVFLADTRRSAAVAESENKRNQEAILRLLNEMGDLADGDLTVRAKVTEDITGAIADSMNYTIDELRTLVGRTTPPSGDARPPTRRRSRPSSGAAERQSKEVEETTAQVQVSLDLEVSSTAEEGARVAQPRSPRPAGRARWGAISANDIREQIRRRRNGSAAGRELAGDRRDVSSSRTSPSDERGRADSRRAGRCGG